MLLHSLQRIQLRVETVRRNGLTDGVAKVQSETCPTSCVGNHVRQYAVVKVDELVEVGFLRNNRVVPAHDDLGVGEVLMRSPEEIGRVASKALDPAFEAIDRF